MEYDDKRVFEREHSYYRWCAGHLLRSNYGKYNSFPELANINEPEIIERIHNEYIDAEPIDKNKYFSANSIVLNISKPEVKKIVAAGLDIANKAARNRNIFVAASIGPIPEMLTKPILILKLLGMNTSLS